MRNEYSGNGAGKLRPDSSTHRVILRADVSALSNRRMIENSEARPTTPRNEAMRESWDKNAAERRDPGRVFWITYNKCLCGCDGPLVRRKLARQQHFFLQRHDTRLKSLALRVVRGEASADEIPELTKRLSSSIKFLKKMPELRKAFE